MGYGHDIIRIVIGIIEFYNLAWERSVDYNRCFQELNQGGIRFLFFFSGLAGLGVPLWVFLFPVAAVDFFPGAGGRILPFTALVAK